MVNDAATCGDEGHRRRRRSLQSHAQATRPQRHVLGCLRAVGEGAMGGAVADWVPGKRGTEVGRTVDSVRR